MDFKMLEKEKTKFESLSEDELFKKDPSTAALLSFHPIYDSLNAWHEKFGFLLSEKDYKVLARASINMKGAIYEGLAKDKRYIYEREISKG